MTNRKTIKTIFTRIRNKRIIVIIKFDDENFIFLSPNNIKQNTSLNINELELLVGSTVRIEYYKIGDKLLNKTICNHENLIVKEYYFDLIKPVDILRQENKSQLLPFKKIVKIFYFDKFGRENVGIKTEDNAVIFLPAKRFELQSKLETRNLQILLGSYIMPEYYKKGESFNDGTIVSKDNAILKWINLRYTDNVDRMIQKYENSLDDNDDEYLNDRNNGPSDYGYNSWDEMAFFEVFEGDIDAWNHYNQ